MLPLLWILPILWGIKALSDDDKEKLVKLLPSFIKLMYAFANVDKIVKKEEDKIKEFYESALKGLEEISYTKNKVPKLKDEINLIVKNRHNIKLSEALKSMMKISGYIELLKKMELDDKKIEEIINADEHKSKSELKLLERYKKFLKSKDKSKTIKEIEKEEENDLIPIPTHYKYINEESSFFEKSTKMCEDGLIEIKSDCKDFKNIADLSENEYYIIHPKNSNYLYPISRIDKIKDDTIEEFISIASSLGAIEINVNIARLEKKVSKSDSKTKVDASIPSSNMDGKSEKSTKNERYTEYTLSKSKKFKTGIKETKQLVLNKSIWTKGDIKTKDLINSVYSNNPIAEWEEEIYLKSFITNIDKSIFEGALKIAELYSINIDTNIESSFEKLSEEKIKISIKF